MEQRYFASHSIKSHELARRIRINALEMVTRAKASHIGSALSIADIVACLYSGVLRYDAANSLLKTRDRFILSKGHACVALYAALAECGFFPIEDLLNYGDDYSVLMNHASHKVRGVEFSSGSLGHGLPFGTGKALSAKRNSRDKWRVFVLMSDGELGEGSNWEAMMFAAHHCLDNLVVILDYNKLQSLGTVEETLRVEPLVDKVRSFGWATCEVDGHCHETLTSSLTNVPWQSNKPSLLIAHTTKGKGVSFMENTVEWHYKSPSADQLVRALEELRHS
jgi:transketolase